MTQISEKQEEVPLVQDQEAEDAEHEDASQELDSRFHQPTPSPFKRAALIVFILFLFWLAMSMRWSSRKKPEIIYASRQLF
jgi:hypothetical protein